MARLSVPAMRAEVDLDDYQVDGVKWMAKRGRFIVGDPMGLGKSVQSIAYGALLHHRGDVERILVVSPASLRINFAREVEKFTHFRTVVLDGDKRKRDKVLASFDADVLVVGYEQLVTHLDQLNEIGFGYVIADEAHYVKSPDSKRTQALMGLEFQYLALMTGTPLENAPNELWPLLDLVSPGHFGDYEDFKGRWCVIRRWEMERTLRNGKTITVPMERVVGCTDTAGLFDVLSTHMLRRSKDVLKLAEPRFVTVEVPMTARQRKIYDEAEADLGVELTEEFLSIPDNQVLVLRLRQIASTTATIDEKHSDESGKLDAAVDRIRETMWTESHSIAFVMFKPTARALRRRLQAEGVVAQLYTGDMSASARDEALSAWRAGGGVLVATMQTAGTGLTLTEARSVFVIEKPYTPSKYAQAVARVWRRGQDKVPMIYEFVCTDSIDEVVERMHERKQAMADQIVDGMSDEWGEDDFELWLEAEEAS